MLTFKNTNLFFACLLIILIIVDILYDLPHPAVTALVLLLAYSLILFYGCYNIRSGFFMKVFSSAKTASKEIAFSFDDGPVENLTSQILGTLKRYEIQAVFFCIGNRIAGNEKIFRQLCNDGHIIGNHSFTHHFLFDLFSAKKMCAELKRMNLKTEKLTGFKPRLFRPPYGVLNPNLRKAIQDGSYTPVGWSVRSLDTVIKDEKKLFNRIIKALKPGAVYLFHDTSEVMIAILPAFIKHVKDKGYNIVRLDKMLALQPYA